MFDTIVTLAKQTHDFYRQFDLNQITTDFATSEFRPFIKKGKILGGASNGRKRGDIDSYTADQGLYGTATYCYAWHPQGHQVNCFVSIRVGLFLTWLIQTL